MELAEAPYSEVLIALDRPDSHARILEHSPTGKVPLLQTEEGPVWDSLAIGEYLAESFPEAYLWPRGEYARAVARSVCAEMHSGFTALRNHCPMNIEASLPEIGRLVWRDKPGVRADMARLGGLWSELLAAQPAGALLFGEFTIADAYFAPVCMRIKTYELPLPADLLAYVERVCALPGVKAWIDEALAEHDFIDFDEPYRLGR
ncbi:maleylacetoacetate isomerase [compost metagenome]